MLAKSFFLIVFLGCVISINSCGVSDLGSQETQKENKANISGGKYIGCWGGMKGGRIKITGDEIIDLGAKDRSLYKQISHRPRSGEDREQYVLKSESKFEKSFLDTVVSISFENDGLAYILTYGSLAEMSKNKFSGMGTFEKGPCDEIEKYDDSKWPLRAAK